MSNETTSSEPTPEQIQALEKMAKEAVGGMIEDARSRFTASLSENPIYAVDVISIAMGETGYFEKASSSYLEDKETNQGTSNFTKYSDYIDNKQPDWYDIKVQQTRWPSIFIDWVFIQAFGPDVARRLLCRPDGPSAGYSMRHSYEYLNKANKIVDKADIGEIVYFISQTTGEIDHMGLIYKVDATHVFCVEADYGDLVAKTAYKLNEPTIYAYAKLNFDENKDTDMINIHVTPKVSTWEIYNPDFPNDPPVRYNTITIVTPPIPEPKWPPPNEDAETGTTTVETKPIQPSADQIADATVIVASTAQQALEISMSANMTPSSTSSSDDDDSQPQGFDWSSLGCFGPNSSNFKVIPPDTTATITLSDETQNFKIYNKTGIQDIIGPLQLYDRYENMQCNLMDFNGMGKYFKTLHFWNSNFYGDIEYLNSDSTLEKLDLNHTAITGSIANIRSLQNLETLYLYNTSVYGELKNIDSLSKLKEFNLNSTNVDGDLAGISKLTNLEIFDISDTFVYGDLSALSPLQNLKEIWINCNSTQGITGDIQNISGVASLTRIHLRGGDIYGDIACLSKLENLEKIFFSDSVIHGDFASMYRASSASPGSGSSSGSSSSSSSGESSKKDLSEIEFIRVPTLTGTMSGLNKLQSLTHVYLNKINTTGKTEDVQGLTKLTELKLQSINMTGDIANLSALTNIEWLMISDTPIQGNFEAISSMTKMERLEIDNDNNLTGSFNFVSKFGNLVNLRLCVIPRLTGDISSFAGLTKLEHLWCYRTSASGDIAKLSGLGNKLIGLRIYNNKNVYGNMNALSALTKLEYINIFEPKVRGDISNIKGKLPNLILCNEGTNYDNSKWS